MGFRLPTFPSPSSPFSSKVSRGEGGKKRTLLFHIDQTNPSKKSSVRHVSVSASRERARRMGGGGAGGVNSKKSTEKRYIEISTFFIREHRKLPMPRSLTGAGICFFSRSKKNPTLPPCPLTTSWMDSFPSFARGKRGGGRLFSGRLGIFIPSLFQARSVNIDFSPFSTRTAADGIFPLPPSSSEYSTK